MMKIRFFVILLSVLLQTYGCSKTDTPKNPVISIEEGCQTVNAESEGGKFSITFSISQPVIGAELSAYSPEDWITDITVCENRVDFSVNPYLSKGSRETVLSIEYIFGDMSVYGQVKILQNGLEYDYAYEAANVSGELIYQSGAPLYQKIIYFTDKEQNAAGSSVILLVILDNKPSDRNEMGLSEGCYPIEQNGEPKTIWEALYYEINNSGNGYALGPVPLTEGSLDIIASEDGYIYEGDFKDKSGKTYWTRYTGKLDIKDRTGESTLDKDIEVVTDSMTGSVTFYGKGQYGFGWHIELTDPMNEGQLLSVDLYSGESSADSGIPDGIYTGSDQRIPGNFIRGYRGSTVFVGSWFMTFIGNNVYSPSAPLSDGTIKVEQTGPGYYVFTFDCIDDAIFPHRITGKWEGYVDVYEMTSAPNS